MRILSYIVALLLSFPLFAEKNDGFIEADGCIVDGSHVQLMGKLTTETLATNSNETQIYWILDTEKVYCTEGYDPKTKTLSRLEKNCSHFQLKLSPEQYDDHRQLLGKSVIVKGTAFIAKPEFQLAGMMIEVNEIELESEQ